MTDTITKSLAKMWATEQTYAIKRRDRSRCLPETFVRNNGGDVVLESAVTVI